MMDCTDKLREENLKVCMKKINGFPASQTREVFTDDGVKKVMFNEVLFRHFTWDGIDLVEQNARNTDKRWSGTKYVDEIHEMLDPNVFFIDLHLNNTYLEDDGTRRPYDNSYIQYFEVKDGKLKEWREYFNSLMRAKFDGIEIPKVEGMPPVELDRARLAEKVAAGTVRVPGDYPQPLSDDMPEEELRERNRKRVVEFIQTPPKDRISMFAPDAVKKVMFTENYNTPFVWEGWDLIAENQRRNSEEGNVQFTIHKIHPGKDPNLFIVELVGCGPHFLGDGEYSLYANEYIYLIRLEHGLVKEWREYYNSYVRAMWAGQVPKDYAGPSDPVERDRQALEARRAQDMSRNSR